MRQLATIQRIRALEPIEGADSIEKASVLGWELVVKRGEFCLGALCVYIEVDSVLPSGKPEFEFLASRGYRIKTVRLRGQLSQGIAFPISVLPIGTTIVEGYDVTDVLGITKYEPKIPACLSGTARGNFPPWLTKTDEVRWQNLYRELPGRVGEACYITEKIDGSSVTYYLKDGVFGVCSRNLDLVESEGNTMWLWARTHGVEERLRALGYLDVAIQGEIFGPGIQGNKYKRLLVDVRFFNLLIDGVKQGLDVFRDSMHLMELNPVPLLNENWSLDTSGLMELARGESVLGSTVREGIVVRTLDGTFSFKAINPDFSLKYGDS